MSRYNQGGWSCRSPCPHNCTIELESFDRILQRLAELAFPITSSISRLASRVGHGVGLEATEPPPIAEYDHTILESGMLITLEPGVASEIDGRSIAQPAEPPVTDPYAEWCDGESGRPPTYVDPSIIVGTRIKRCRNHQSEGSQVLRAASGGRGKNSIADSIDF
jgi:hypothetical protein